MATWRQRARELRTEITALGYACQEPRVPWYAKTLAACLVAYALSPVDLIPDPIPVLGYVDDLVLLPLGIVLVVRMVPPDVMAKCRERARGGVQRSPQGRWVATALIVVVWLAIAAAGARILWRWIGSYG